MKKRILYAILLLAGLGLLAGAVAVLSEAATATIDLSQGDEGARGEMRFELLGIPVFWRSLNGLARVERQDYQVSERTSRSYFGIRLKRVDRLVFLDAQDRELGWSERSALLNCSDAVARFLAGDASEYHCRQQRTGSRWDVATDALTNVLFALMLLLAGTILSLAGLGGIWRPPGKSARTRRRKRGG